MYTLPTVSLVHLSMLTAFFGRTTFVCLHTYSGVWFGESKCYLLLHTYSGVWFGESKCYLLLHTYVACGLVKVNFIYSYTPMWRVVW